MPETSPLDEDALTAAHVAVEDECDGAPAGIMPLSTREGWRIAIKATCARGPVTWRSRTGSATGCAATG